MAKAKERTGYYCSSSDDEFTCMKQIANGDRAEFGKVVELYMNDMFRFAYSMLGKKEEAEDVVQEACLRLWRNAGQWKPSGSIKSWLLSITHNLCIDVLRKNKNNVPLDKVVFNLSDERKSQLQKHQDWESAKIISEALFVLPERQRTALMLVYYHAHSNGEAAEIMGVSVAALESLLARGRRKLKDLLLSSKEMLLGE